MVNSMESLHKVALLSRKDILHIVLRVHINKRKHTALDLNLQFVATLEGMQHVVQIESHLGWLTRGKRNRLRHAFSETPADNAPAH